VLRVIFEEMGQEGGGKENGDFDGCVTSEVSEACIGDERMRLMSRLVYTSEGQLRIASSIIAHCN